MDAGVALARLAADMEHEHGLLGRVRLVFAVVRVHDEPVADERGRPVALLAHHPRRTQLAHGRGNRSRVAVRGDLDHLREAVDLRIDPRAEAGPHVALDAGDVGVR